MPRASAATKETFEEKICDRKVVVYKTLLNPSVVRLMGEKLRHKIFLKFGLFKAKPNDIQLSSIEKVYEPFLMLEAKYLIEYLRRREISFEVDPEVQEIIVLDQSFKPELFEEARSKAGRIVRLEIKERLTHEERAYVVLNKKGVEVPLDAIPHAPSEEEPEKILKEHGENVGVLEFEPESEVEIVRSKIFKRPPDTFKVIRERFEVSDRSLVYIPIYEITFKNVRTGETKKVRIDGVNGKSLSQKNVFETLASFFKL